MRPSAPRLPLIRPEPKQRPEKWPGRADESKPQAQKQHRILPWRSVEFSKFGRGAESCLLSLVYVAPLSTPFGGCCPRLRSLCKGLPGMVLVWLSKARADRFTANTYGAFAERSSRRQTHRPATPSSSTPLCAAQARPARSFGHQETRVRSETPRLSPCRRRETIFRGPRGWRLTSFLHHRRRLHLAGTPAGVSESGTGGLWAWVCGR